MSFEMVSQMNSPVAGRALDRNVEFEYRPVPVLAPLSLFFGVCSFAGILAVAGLSIAVVGMALAMACLWQIRRSQGELGGRMLARIGLALSAFFFVCGGGYHGFVYATEVPEGYTRVNFSWLSKQEITYDNGKLKLAPEVAELDGQPIFIKGYMYPTRQQTGISEFTLLKDTGQCCFGGQPKMNDMIAVRFKDGMTVNHREMQLVGVGGILRARQVVQSGELTAVYSIEGTHFR